MSQESAKRQADGGTQNLAAKWQGTSTGVKVAAVGAVLLGLFLCCGLPMIGGGVWLLWSRSAQDDAVNEEMRKLQGKWARISVEADAKILTDKEASPKVTITISGEKWIDKSAAGVHEAIFKINPAQNPKHIDITMFGKALPGIYLVEGDTLKTAVPFPFGGDFTNISKRPAGFRTKQGDGFIVTFYKRVKS
jgi:uncharacterized protein (TIGR03067 family)